MDLGDELSMGWMIDLQHITNYLHQVRDLTLLEMNEEQYLVMACDSLGAIGPKPLDVVQASVETVASFTVRVPLFEVISIGATPMYVVDCLTVEMDGVGRELIAAIQSYCRKAGINQPVQFNGSTEDNIPTSQTGVGIMVWGVLRKNEWYVGTTKKNDIVVCAGLPKSGPRYEMNIDDPEILSLEDCQFLRKQLNVRDMLPVGSKGIAYEAEQLALSMKGSFVPHLQTQVSLTDSAGPASCLLFTTSPEEMERLSQLIVAPLTVIGHLEGKR